VPTAGNIASASGGGFLVQAGHVFAQAGSYTVTTTLLDAGGATATTAAVVTQGEYLAPINVTAVEGQSFSGNVADFTPPPPNPGG
jgi:hypothetical protein